MLLVRVQHGVHAKDGQHEMQLVTIVRRLTFKYIQIILEPVLLFRDGVDVGSAGRSRKPERPVQQAVFGKGGVSDGHGRDAKRHASSSLPPGSPHAKRAMTQRETQLLRSRPHPSAVGSHVAELPLLTMVDRRRDDDKR